MSDISQEDQLKAAQLVSMESFAKLLSQRIRDPERSNDAVSKTFSSYTKEQILTWLKSPTANAKNLVLASRQLFQNSIEYRRLIYYYAYMSLFAYTISPVGFDAQKAKTDNFLKQYTKIASLVERMNLRHEMRRGLVNALVDGVAYGIILESNVSWFVQYINPDYCVLSSKSDGTYIFSIDMSQIKSADLPKYPPIVESMYNEYLSSGVKLQEVPEDSCFCIKADESVDYPIPFWAGLMPAVFDLENYKELAEVATKLDIFKLIAFEIPLDEKNKPTMTWDMIKKFYDLVANNVPSAVGVAAVPGKINAVDFSGSAVGNTTDDISSAIQRFYYSSGNSPLLFGDASNKSSSALSLSIKSDEEIVLALMAQCERVINRLLKSQAGTQKFKINFLPVTIYSKEKELGYLKEASTLGLPVKTAYGAVLNLQQSDMLGMSYLENDVLNINDKLVPLSSTYTQASGETGRPTDDTETPSESKEQTVDDGTNENRE